MNKTIWKKGHIRVDHDTGKNVYVLKPTYNPESWIEFAGNERELAIQRGEELSSPNAVLQQMKDMLRSGT